MKKIAFKNITTREELINRIEDDKLSVGCWLSNIKQFISIVETPQHTKPVLIRYSSTYGFTEKTFYI